MALILVVEDEALLRWSLVRRLEGVGHRVLQAGSAAEARAALADGAPDLLILDLSLPDGDGLDFLEACRARTEPAVDRSSR